MKKIAIINQKGGSGKTSFSVLVSLALASKNYKVLAVDCDPQAGLTSFLSPSKDKRLGIFDILIGYDELSILNIERDTITFDCIPSDHRLDKIYSTLDPFSFEHLFDKLDYDYIVFDTPPTVQGITRAAAFVSNQILIPADISEATIEPTLYTIESLKDIKKKAKVYLLGYKEPKDGIKSFIDKTSADFISKLKSNYGGTIPRNISMQKAVADKNQKWNDTKREKILFPILDVIGVK